MPYTIRKRKCKQSDGDSGSYVLSYKDKKGKKHRACHTSRKKARGQIAAIEAEGVERNETMKITLSEIRNLIRQFLNENLMGVKAIGDKGAVIAKIKSANTRKELNATLGELINQLSFSGGNIPAPHILTLKNAIADIKNDMQIAKPEIIEKIGAALTAAKEEEDKFAAQTDPEKEREMIARDVKTRAGLRGQVAGAGKGYDASSVGPLLRGLPTSAGGLQFRSLANNESIQSLKALIQEIVLEEAKKSKAKKSKAKKGQDMDGDGDVDAADYKTKVYMAGGVPKNKALKMSRKFDGK